MKIRGIVKEAAGETPLPGAKIRFLVGDKELAVLYSGSNGRYEHKETSSYIGEILVCEVEKKDYQPQQLTYKIEKEDLELEIELVSLQKKEPAPPGETGAFHWQVPIYGLIGGALGGLIGSAVAKIDAVFVDKIVYGTALGIALGLGLADKKKMVKLIIAGSLGFFLAGLVWVVFLKGMIGRFWGILAAQGLPVVQAAILYALWLGIAGLAFGAALKEPKTLLKLFLAGLAAGAIGGPLAVAAGKIVAKAVGGPAGFNMGLAVWNAVVHALGGLAYGIVLAKTDKKT